MKGAIGSSTDTLTVSTGVGVELDEKKEDDKEEEEDDEEHEDV